MELIYLRDLLYVSYETSLPSGWYWDKQQSTIRLGRLSVVYG